MPSGPNSRVRPIEPDSAVPKAWPARLRLPCSIARRAVRRGRNHFQATSAYEVTNQATIALTQNSRGDPQKRMPPAGSPNSPRTRILLHGLALRASRYSLLTLFSHSQSISHGRTRRNNGTYRSPAYCGARQTGSAHQSAQSANHCARRYSIISSRSASSRHQFGVNQRGLLSCSDESSRGGTVRLRVPAASLRLSKRSAMQSAHRCMMGHRFSSRSSRA